VARAAIEVTHATGATKTGPHRVFVDVEISVIPWLVRHLPSRKFVVVSSPTRHFRIRELKEDPGRWVEFPVLVFLSSMTDDTFLRIGVHPRDPVRLAL